MSQPTITVEVQGPRVVVEYPEQGPQGPTGNASFPTEDGSALADANRFAVGQDVGGVWTWCAKTGSQLLAWLAVAFAPIIHASRHADDGDDPITPEAIGAVADGDARLSDARPPTAHTQAATTLTLTATDVIVGRQSAGAGAGEEISCTSLARTILSRTTAALMRVDLGAAPLAAMRHVYWPVGAWIPATTNGAATGTTEYGTNKVMADSLDYDSGATEEIAWCHGRLERWNKGTIKVRIVYRFDVISSGTTVQALVSGRSYQDGDPLDQAMGTAVTVSDTLQDVGDVCVTAASAALTLAGALDGEQIEQRIKIVRDTSEDNGAGDMRAHGIWIEYTESATEEAAW